MVILDTNVISEMTRSAPEPNVVAWYMRQDSGSLFTTTVTLAEVLYGINLLPEGNRRNGLSEFAGDFFAMKWQERYSPSMRSPQSTMEGFERQSEVLD